MAPAARASIPPSGTAKPLRRILSSASIPPQSETIPDQWESQILARILMKHRVIFVSRPEMEQTLREMKLDYAPNLETAMVMAKQDKGENASVTLIPNGISVMVKS